MNKNIFKDLQFFIMNNKTISLKSEKISLNKSDANHKKAKKVGAALTCVTPMIAIGTALGVASGIEQAQTTDTSLYQHLLQKDVPINQATIIGAHNVGTQPGSGTIFPLSNQTMGVTEMLDQTPVRALAIDVHKVDGEFILNHAGIIDPTVKSITLDQTLTNINGWLDKNPNEAVIMPIELGTLGFGSPGHRPPDFWDNYDDLLSSLKEKFGSKIADTNFLVNFYNEHHHLPSVNELTEAGRQILLIDRFGSDISLSMWTDSASGDLRSIDLSYLFGNNESINYTAESRNLVSEYIQGTGIEKALDGQLPSRINAETVDQIRQAKNGGIVFLDQISPNDPRFLLPEDRSQLLLKPDMSILNGAVHVNQPIVNEVAFGLGAAMNIGSASFSLASGIFQIINQRKFITNIKNGNEIKNILHDIETKEDLKLPGIKKKNISKIQVTLEDLKKRVTKKLKNKTTKTTFTTGLFTALGLASCILGFGLLMPYLIIPLAIAASAVFAFGLITTLVLISYNRNKVNQAIEFALTKPEMYKFFKEKTQKINDNKPDNDPKIKSVLKTNNAFQKTAMGLLVGTLALRATSMAKYAMPLVGGVTGIALNSVLGVSSIIDVIGNALDRKKRFAKPEKILKEYEANLIFKHGLFTKSAFTKYLKTNKYPLNPKKIEPELLTKLQQDCFTKYKASLIAKYQKTHAKYFKKHPEKILTEKQIFQRVLVNKIAKNEANKTFINGILNTLKISIATGSTGIFFPAVLGLLFIISLGLFCLGSISFFIYSKIVQHQIKNKFPI
ncbi:MAG: hypothetical protein WC860_08420 [Candidatus Margulisiibacteriota bacterium]|jgi:hypothetical protein